MLTRHKQSSRLGRVAWAASAVGGLVALSGCGASLSLATAPFSESQAIINAVFLGEKNVTFDELPAVQVENGRIDSVTVKKVGDKARVGGKLSEDGKSWILDTSDLDFGSKYKVSATAVDLRGRETSTEGKFKTFTPSRQVDVYTNVWDGSTYGVGMPITVSFSEAVQNRAELESRLNVTVDKETVPGSWHWKSDSVIAYRPKKYWPAKSRVMVRGDIKGLNIGDDVYAMDNLERKFKIGTANVMKIDAAAHRFRYYRDGELLRDLPTSLGKPGYSTRSGIKVLMSKERNVKFEPDLPETDPEYYNLQIAYAMRVTWSGEYVHSAPWSVGSQGYSNVSHGCINLSTSNAAWVFYESNVGDIVEVVNTGRTQDLGNGWTDWNIPWKDWKAGSALQGDIA